MVAVFAVALVALALAHTDLDIRIAVPSVRERRHRRRQALDVGGYIAEVAARLRAGSSETEAWARTARRHGLDPAVTEEEPNALAQLARSSPQTARGALSAARLSRELGAPIADLLDHYGAILTQAQAAGDAVKVALAAPRTSARLLAALPLLAVGIGIAMGADPLGAIVAGGLGSLAATAGVGLLLAGYLWTRSMIGAAMRGGRIEEAIDAHLVTGALATGASIPRALSAVGRAADRAELASAGELLLLGAGWDEAWPQPGMIARCLEPAWTDGANPVPLLDGAAHTVLMRSDRVAKEAAARLSVRMALPLGLCFLPAFVLIGVVPMTISLGLGL